MLIALIQSVILYHRGYLTHILAVTIQSKQGRALRFPYPLPLKHNEVFSIMYKGSISNPAKLPEQQHSTYFELFMLITLVRVCCHFGSTPYTNY